MDSNLSFQLQHAFASGAIVTYFPAPYRCTVRDVVACVQADPGDGETLTFANGSDTLGVATFGTTIAAGALATWVADATNGNKVLAEGDLIKITSSTATAADCIINLELDPIARTETGYDV